MYFLSYHNGNKGFLKLLVEHLSADIYAWEPASVAGVTVVPANRILQPANLRDEKNVTCKNDYIKIVAFSVDPQLLFLEEEKYTHFSIMIRSFIFLQQRQKLKKKIFYCLTDNKINVSKFISSLVQNFRLYSLSLQHVIYLGKNKTSNIKILQKGPPLPKSHLHL